VLHSAPAAPIKIDASIPRDLETVVLIATAKEPADRYRTADEMAEDLRRFLADRPILSRRTAPVEQFIRWCRRNPLVSSLAGTVAVLLVVAVAILSLSNARIRRESAAMAIAVHDKDAALATAHEAVNQMLTRVASKTFADMPKSHPLRVALLEDALKFYDGLVSQEGAEPTLRHEMANVLITMAGLQRELGRYDDAARALKQSIDLLTPLIATDPDPPSIREELANAELDLAFTRHWGSDPTGFEAQQVADQYHKVLAEFDELEREWPERRQPAVLCIRFLANAAFHRGDRAEAKRLRQAAVTRGEAYVEQHPDSIVARTEIAWTCVEQWDGLADDSKSHSADAEHTLDDGLHQVAAILAQNPESTQGADVATALRFRKGLQLCKEDHIDEALPQLNGAIDGIENLCANFPYNTDYWNSLQWFYYESVTRLRNAGRLTEAQGLARRYLHWLIQIAPQAAEKPESKAKLSECQTELAELLRSLKLEQEAKHVAEIEPTTDRQATPKISAP
jgi:eukaryotic-like serine/threonine-protein kinase